ncbi:hypothetical protein Tco_0824722 [Tanacetum coccineum]|uniref:Casein kinase substrate phosphoprotein PP28 domain-containing protein n=1 Tax=Tanacetum coccineum TaxID=301880 RepID=A0ABQ5AQL1_9ASTR
MSLKYLNAISHINKENDKAEVYDEVIDVEVVEQSKVLEDKEIEEEVDDDELDRSGDDNPTRTQLLYYDHELEKEDDSNVTNKGVTTARERHMTIEEARLQLQETKRLADLKAAKEKIRGKAKKADP